MSGILGLIHFSDEPVDPAVLSVMREAMAHYGPDGNRLWNDGPAGLGQMTLWNTPEAILESLPRVQAEHNLAFTAEARIDNREELGGLLGLNGAELVGMPDGDLLLRAYLRWGKDAPQRIFGDWSFAAWHPRERRLFLARDHTGNTALYYYSDTRRFAFASSQKAILALAGVPRRLNEHRLAQVLTSWMGDCTQTFFSDIQSIPPAHTLTLSGGRPEMRQYWSIDNQPEIRIRDSREYAEGLREVLDTAVRCRLRSLRPVGATLSGGLDSGSVSALAARSLGEAGRRLPVFSSVPLYDVTGAVGPYRFGDEEPFIRATADHAGNIDVQWLRSDCIHPLEAIRRVLDIQDAPGHAAANVYWILDVLQSARQGGLGALLTGQGGNGTISWKGTAWTVPGQKRDGWEFWSRRLFFEGVLPLVPDSLIAIRDGWRSRSASWVHSAILPDFADRIGLAPLRFQEEARRRELGLQCKRHPRRVRLALVAPGRNPVGAVWAEWGAAFGLEVRDPTLDARVVEYCFSIPDRFFLGPKREERYLLRTAMDGLLPELVLRNPRRGRQAADLPSRLRAHADIMERELRVLEKSKIVNGYIQIEKIRSVWTDILSSPPNPLPFNRTVSILTRGMMAGIFVESFS